MKALWADTAFLAGQGVMDYSLLVGVDSPNGALVVGIIDFLRQVCNGLSYHGYCRHCRVYYPCIVHMSACTSCFCDRQQGPGPSRFLTLWQSVLVTMCTHVAQEGIWNNSD